MKTDEAVQYILDEENISKYRMAQDLGCAPILVNYWLNGTKMGEQYREVFSRVYKVDIDDEVNVQK